MGHLSYTALLPRFSYGYKSLQDIKVQILIQASETGLETLHFYILLGNTDAVCGMDHTLRSRLSRSPDSGFF